MISVLLRLEAYVMLSSNTCYVVSLEFIWLTNDIIDIQSTLPNVYIVFFSDASVDMIELQVETTLAFVVCIVAAILVTHAIVHKSKAPKFYLGWSAVSCMASGKLVMVVHWIKPVQQKYKSWRLHRDNHFAHYIASSSN